MPPAITRRELLKLAGSAAYAPLFAGGVLTGGCGSGAGYSAPPMPGGDGYPGTDDQLLDEIEAAAFRYYWEQTDPATGQIKDRALAAGNDTRTLSSIAATGFGLTVLCIGDQHGFLPSAQIAARVQTTLQFILDQLQGYNGFFYHFVDMSSGIRAGSSEVSSIDTAILLCGVLTCRAHFPQTQIATLATELYQRVNWPWMLNGGSTFAMAWTPESGFAAGRWDHYSELMMLYLLAIGSQTHPIPSSSWSAWSRPTITYQGLTYTSGADPLFVHQYSHAWFDFRSRTDAYADYFQNSVTATEAHRLFCISLESQFSDYSSDLWGITAADSAAGYAVWGGPPPIGPIDGTVVPCAAGGSLPFLYTDTIHVLRWIRGHYSQAWQRYGYVDAFNPLTGWYDSDVLGIDLGIMAVMAENQRSGFVWQTFMSNPEVAAAMTLAGFH
jgi:hypothetical protein